MVLNMEKKDILNAFNGVIESTALWEEMARILYPLGGDIFETKFINSLEIHQELVWKMIVNYRDYSELHEEEFTIFIDILYDLANGKAISHNNKILTDREQILDLFLNPEFVLQEAIHLLI
jgi:hypothetical protein